MVRRLFDLVAALIGLMMSAPLIAVAAVLVKVSSPGPVFYRAHRVGRHGTVFTMFKLRTMHLRRDHGSSITSSTDPRVFPAGRLLRALKIDELPQLWNILRGEMAVVGPRPEAPDIVQKWYTDEYRRSLSVRPGLTSPGSILYYQCGEQQLPDGETEDYYVRFLLPDKMRADLDWIDHAGLFDDLIIIGRTAWVLMLRVFRRPQPRYASGPADDASIASPRRAA